MGVEGRGGGARGADVSCPSVRKGARREVPWAWRWVKDSGSEVPERRIVGGAVIKAQGSREA